MDFKDYPKTLKAINTETAEGKLLFAAIGQIKNRCQPDDTLEKIIADLTNKAKNIFDNATNNPGRNSNPGSAGAELEAALR